MLRRQLAQSCFMRSRPVRLFHGGRLLGVNKSSIPSVILEELRDASKLTQASKMKDENRSILILEPERTRDRKYSELINDLDSQGSRKYLDYSAVEMFKQDLNDNKEMEESYVTLIENFRPKKTEITQTGLEWIQQRLKESFTKKQLLDYIRDHENGSNLMIGRGFSKSNKNKLTDSIVRGIWGSKVSDKLTTIDDLYVHRTIKLSECDIFLILSENGFIIQYISRTGVKISFDSPNEIRFSGTESQVSNAEININSILSNTHREKIDLSLIKRLFVEKYNKFPLDLIGKNTEVYFNHIGDDVYELVSLNANQIKRSRRLILWLLNHNKHFREDLHLSGDFDFQDLLPFKDDDSLTWVDRNTSLYLLNKKVEDNASPVSLRKDLDKYSDKSLSIHDDHYEEVIDSAKSLPNSSRESNPRNPPAEHSNTTLGELNMQGVTSEKQIDSTTNEEVQEAEPNDQSSSILSRVERDQIYDQLVNFNYMSKLRGVSANHLNEPIFTITLTNILFEEDSLQLLKDNSVEHLAKIKKDIKYTFTPNLQSINDKALSMSLYDYPHLTNRGINQFMVKDPHNYSIQLRFLPSLYPDNMTDNLENQINYPPVEIWIDLNEKSKPDLESMNIVTVEGENNILVQLPGIRSDLKVCCQLSGNLLDFDGEEKRQSEDAPSDIDEILNATTARYTKLDNQPGVNDFLANSKLDFSGYAATSIHPYIDLRIDGKKVRYHYINVFYRRSLDLCYSNGDSERMVQLNVVEGGSLGGRKLEVNVIGDLSNSLDKAAFDRLLNDSIKLATEL